MTISKPHVITAHIVVLCIALPQVKIDNPKSNCFLLSQAWPLTQPQPTWLHHIKLNPSDLWFTPWCINHIKNDKLGVVKFITMTSIVNKGTGWEWLLIGLNSQLQYHQKQLTPTTESGPADRYLSYIITFTFYTFKAKGKRNIVFPGTRQHSTRGQQQPDTKNLHLRGNNCKTCDCSWAGSPGNHYK